MKEIPLYELPGGHLDFFGFKLYRLKNPLKVKKDLSDMPLKTNIPHRHNFYEICIFQDGGGSHEIDFLSYKVKPLSVHFISPGQVHLLQGTNNNLGYVMAFTEGFLSDEKGTPDWLMDLPFFNALKAVQTMELEWDQFSEIIFLLKQILSDYNMAKDRSKPIIQAYCKILLMKCAFYWEPQVDDEKVSNASVRLVNQFKESIEQNYEKNHNVKKYAEAFNVSTSYLNKSCKKVVGTTASELISRRVILEARRLLVFSDYTNKEIAYKLNFEDPAYFSRIFKIKTGYSPLKYKKVVRDMSMLRD